MTGDGRGGDVGREKVDVRVEVFADQLEALDALAADLTATGDRSQLLRGVLDGWLRQRAERFVWTKPDQFDLR